MIHPVPLCILTKLAWLAETPGSRGAVTAQGLEKYLMTKIYHKVFAVSELDRERDESLTMRMSALGFIEPKHLDIPELYHDEKAWILARKELHKINNYKVSGLTQTLQPLKACLNGVWLLW